MTSEASYRRIVEASEYFRVTAVYEHDCLFAFLGGAVVGSGNRLVATRGTTASPELLQWVLLLSLSAVPDFNSNFSWLWVSACVLHINCFHPSTSGTPGALPILDCCREKSYVVWLLLILLPMSIEVTHIVGLRFFASYFVVKNGGRKSGRARVPSESVVTTHINPCDGHCSIFCCCCCTFLRLSSSSNSRSRAPPRTRGTCEQIQILPRTRYSVQH